MMRIIFIKTAIACVVLACQLSAGAQVCSGSLGDPVVNVNFGSGSGPGGALQAAATNYSFTSSSCPNDGSYTVVNSTSGCFGGTWHTISGDHTGDGNSGNGSGYMMLVNASFEPGIFYLDTVKNLCGNTTYEFAAWIVNVLLPSSCSGNGITPNLTFNIETTDHKVLGTYSTGSISASGSPAWRQYGLFFTTPVNVSDVVIKIFNNAPGGCGNDLALDDITFRPCGPTVTASVVNLNQTAFDVCKGGTASVPLKATIGSGYISPARQWQLSIDSGTTWSDIAGATGLTYQFDKTATGTYKYRLTVAESNNIGVSNCRVASNVVNVTIHDFPVISATDNSPVCEKRPINLSATGGVKYAWTGPAGFTSTLAVPSLIAQSNSAGKYTVTGTDQFGCVNTTSVTIVTSPIPQATIGEAQTFCEGISVSLQAGGGISYAWSPATGLSATDIPNPVAKPLDSTIYSVAVSGGNNCTDTVTVALNVLKKPTANAGPDKIILKGQSITLDASVGGSDVSINWSPASFLNDPLLAQPVAKPVADISYTLDVVSNAGCGSASDNMFIKVYNDIYIPTAFSPNNDGLNDTWHIDGLVAAPNARVLVYNRFGNIVFETVGNNQQWDGTYKGQPLSPGAYAYMIDLKNGLPIRKGTVMILR